MALAGGAVFAYQFDWSSPDPRIGACHCIELPFVFGSGDAWAGSRLIGGGNPDEMARLADVMMDTWIAFVATGSPNNATVSPWKAYNASAGRTVMHLGSELKAGPA
jgi:para-nitrobenzyl esterase